MPYVVIRHYKESTKLIDELERRSADVENLIKAIPGFIAYKLGSLGNWWVQRQCI